MTLHLTPSKKLLVRGVLHQYFFSVYYVPNSVYAVMPWSYEEEHCVRSVGALAGVHEIN
jgi:hypothetical protein